MYFLKSSEVRDHSVLKADFWRSRFPGLSCVPTWPLVCVRRWRERGLCVAPYSYKDTSPTRSGPHPYDLNDLRNLFKGLTSIYYHTGVRSLMYEFVGVGEKVTP